MTPINTSRKGATFERTVVADLIGRGWPFVIRCSNSKGGCDVIAVCRAEVALIEAKSNGVLPPDEWNDLYDLAMAAGAVPVLAEPVDRRRERGAPPVRYWRIIGRKTPGGSARQPRDDWHADEALEKGA